MVAIVAVPLNEQRYHNSLHFGAVLYTLYSARMSPENTHKLMGFYMEVLILGVMLYYMHGICFSKLFPIGCSYRVKSWENYMNLPTMQASDSVDVKAWIVSLPQEGLYNGPS